MVLPWLGYRGKEAGRKALEYRLNGCIQEDGGFAYEIKDRTVYLPCHGAETLRYLHWFAQSDDARAKGLLNLLLKIQSEEGGVALRIQEEPSFLLLGLGSGSARFPAVA